MNLCILTDNSAHFPPSTSSGKRLIHVLPLRTGLDRIIPPTIDDFLPAFQELEREFNNILVLTASGRILPVAEIARQAAVQHGGMAKIDVLDSQQIGAGLGLLAQIGTQVALADAPLVDVENAIRGAMANMYTLICPALLPSSEARMTDGDGDLPFTIYSMEEGALTLYKKVRTRRHLMETFLEFLEEFENPNHVVFIHAPHSLLRARPLRDAAAELFPKIPFTELEMNNTLTTLFGPQAVGLTVMELVRH